MVQNLWQTVLHRWLLNPFSASIFKLLATASVLITTQYIYTRMKCCIFFAPSKVYFPSRKQEIKFMTFYMQYHLHYHFHSYYSYKILFRIKTVHILLYTHYSYLTAGFSGMTGHKADEVTWLKITCVGSVNWNLAMH